MIKYATDRGIGVRVSTNSTFLGEHEIEQIFWSNLTSIIVCLDGATKETHERYRIGSEFEEVVAGIQRLAETRRTLRRERPFIRLQFLVFSYNTSDKMTQVREEIRARTLPLCRTCQYSDYGSTLFNFSDE